MLTIIRINCIKVLEKVTNKKLETYGDLMNKMFAWISIPMEYNKAIELIKNFGRKLIQLIIKKCNKNL